MPATLPMFQFSTQEAWYWEIAFVTPELAPISLAGRTFEVPITLANDNAPKATLALGSGLEVKTGTTNVLIGRVAKAIASAWQTGEYTLDIIELANDDRRRFMPVRATFDQPSAFFGSNAFQQQAAYAANRLSVVTAVNLPGPQGLPPAHRWIGTALSFQNPDNSYEAPVDLRGPAGPPTIVNGKTGDSITLVAPDIASGVFDPARIPALDAATIGSGVFDIARIPIIPSQKQEVSSGDLSALTPAQLADIGQGTVVTLTDGRRLVYSAGPKTAEASYVVLADLTPDWTAVQGKPAAFPPSAHGHPISDVTGLQGALDGKTAPADVTAAILAQVSDVPRYISRVTVGDGVANDAIALANLDATSVTSLILDKGIVLIGSNLTLTKPLKVFPGARFRVANGVTLTIVGAFDALPFWVFECIGTGKVVLIGISEGYGEWWGAVGQQVGVPSVDSMGAFNAALQALYCVKPLAARYFTTGTIDTYAGGLPRKFRGAVTDTTAFFCNSPSATIVQVGRAGGAITVAPDVGTFTVVRTVDYVVPAAEADDWFLASRGVAFVNCTGSRFSDIVSTDSQIGVYHTDISGWARDIIGTKDKSPAGDRWYGHYFDGEHGRFPTYECWLMRAKGTIGAGSSRGLYGKGKLADLWNIQPDVAGCRKQMHFIGDASATGCIDFRLVDPHVDVFWDFGICVENMGPQGAGIVRGIYGVPNASATGPTLWLKGCPGWMVNGGEHDNANNAQTITVRAVVIEDSPGADVAQFRSLAGYSDILVKNSNRAKISYMADKTDTTQQTVSIVVENSSDCSFEIGAAGNYGASISTDATSLRNKVDVSRTRTTTGDGKLVLINGAQVFHDGYTALGSKIEGMGSLGAAAKANLASNPTAAAGVWTDLVAATEDFDPLNMMVNGVWTCKQAGTYRATSRAGIAFGTAPTAVRYAFKRGPSATAAIYDRSQTRIASPVTDTTIATETLIKCAVGDIIVPSIFPVGQAVVVDKTYFDFTVVRIGD